jgi:hypothetical protein
MLPPSAIVTKVSSGIGSTLYSSGHLLIFVGLAPVPLCDPATSRSSERSEGRDRTEGTAVHVAGLQAFPEALTVDSCDADRVNLASMAGDLASSDHLASVGREQLGQR